MKKLHEIAHIAAWASRALWYAAWAIAVFGCGIGWGDPRFNHLVVFQTYFAGFCGQLWLAAAFLQNRNARKIASAP